MTAGFSHHKSTDSKKNKKKSAMDQLLEDTNTVCTLTYAIDNIRNLSDTEIVDIMEAIALGKTSKDEQVRIVISNFLGTVTSAKLPKNHPLIKIAI
jgi:hypothetical protein